MDNEKYKKVIFQLDELIRHLLVDSNDIKKGRSEMWFNWWDNIIENNRSVYDEIYLDE